MKKLIYRLQVGNKGIYGSRFHYDIIRIVFDKYDFNTDDNHPAPYQDEEIRKKTQNNGADFYEESRFAFPSIKSMFSWFYGDSIEQFFKEPEFKIYIIEVDETDMVESKYQVIYNLNKSRVARVVNSYRELIDLI